MALPQGLSLNAFSLICSGTHTFTRIPRPDDREQREELEREHGIRLWNREGFSYAEGSIDLPNAEIIEVECGNDSELHSFGLRQALFKHARTVTPDASFGSGGILHVAGLITPERHGRALSEVEVLLRVVEEGVVAPTTLLVARTRHRWVFDGTLEQKDLQELAVGGYALRVNGGGPLRGRVLRFENGAMVIESRQTEHTVMAAEYRLRADVVLVRRLLGANTLFALQVASGSLATNHRKNQAAIKDRWQTLESALDALGNQFSVGAGTVTIDRDPVTVRVQRAA